MKTIARMMKAVLLKSILLCAVCLFIKGYGQVIELKIDKISERGLNENNISNVKLLPLETNQNSLIGEISDIQMDGSNIFVLDRKNQVLKRFDKNGSYLNDIGRQGKGPGEFIHLFCFCVLPGKNMIIISDQTGEALRYYTFEGKHVLDFKMAGSAKKIMALDASMIVCHHGRMSVLKSGKGSYYEVAYYDFKGTPGPHLFPFSQPRYFDLLPGLEVHPDKKALLYHRAFDYNIYELSRSGEINPLYHFDFKRNNIDTSKFSMSGLNGLKSLSFLTNEIIGFSEVNMTTTHLLMRVHSQKEATYLVIDRKSNSWMNYPQDSSGYIGRSGCLPIPAAMGISDGSLFGVIYPLDILSECQLKKIPKESLFKDVAYIRNPITLKEDDNPILMFYQLK